MEVYAVLLGWLALVGTVVLWAQQEKLAYRVRRVERDLEDFKVKTGRQEFKDSGEILDLRGRLALLELKDPLASQVQKAILDLKVQLDSQAQAAQVQPKEKVSI